MSRFLRPGRTRGAGLVAATIAAAAGVAAAALVGVALARTLALQVATNAKVTNQSGTTKTENIVVTSHGFALYTLTGDSRSHPRCTKADGCFGLWRPLTVSAANRLTKATGIKGKLGVWRRNGFLQVILAGHPLYRYAGDSQRHQATGEGIKSFGGTWHVQRAARSTSGSATTPTTTPMTTTTTSCLYPPC